MINAAFAFGGAPLLVASVEQLTGIHIDHYVELGFGGVVGAVDAFGGVEICPETGDEGPARHTSTSRRAARRSTGSRPWATPARATSPRSATSTASRTSARWSVRSATRRSRPWTFLNPVRYWRINNAAAGAIRVDEDMSPIDLGRSRAR